MIEEIKLEEPHYYAFKKEEDFLKALTQFEKNLKEFVNLVKSGENVFVKISGIADYKDSIARVWAKDGEIRQTTIGGYHSGNRYVYGSKADYFSPVLTWDGLKNKIHPYLSDLIWLKNYTGPTILKRFDKKKEKAKLLEAVQLKDMDGNILAVNDSVLYINARYGGGMKLCRGKIVRFDAVVSADRAETFTIVESGGEESKISNSENFILKI